MEDTTQGKTMQERAAIGQNKKVAVGCWFTSEGRTIPKLIKYEDKEGCRHLIHNIQLIKTIQSTYDGLRVQRYECRIIEEGKCKDLILLFHPGKNTWDMIPKK